jgi:hypothetical protein
MPINEFSDLEEVLRTLSKRDAKGFIPLPQVAQHYLAAGNMVAPTDRKEAKKRIQWSARLVTAVEKLADAGALYRSYRFRDREFNSLSDAIRGIETDTYSDPLAELIPGFYFTVRGKTMSAAAKPALTDEAIRKIVLNTESLYQWAREEGKGGDDEMYANLHNFIRKNRRELVRRIQGE